MKRVGRTRSGFPGLTKRAKTVRGNLNQINIKILLFLKDVVILGNNFVPQGAELFIIMKHSSA